jgi:hypothetical protein
LSCEQLEIFGIGRAHIVHQDSNGNALQLMLYPLKEAWGTGILEISHNGFEGGDSLPLLFQTHPQVIDGFGYFLLVS